MILSTISVLSLTFLFYFVDLIQAQERITAIHFQVDEVPSNETYAQYKGTLPDMQQLSVCFYFKVIRGRTSEDTIFSYGVSENFNEIYIGFLINGLLDIYWEYIQVFITNPVIHLLKWNKFCITMDLINDVGKIYLNENIFTEDIPVPDIIRGGGVLVLGQDQDRLMGGYSYDQSLNSIVASLAVFDGIISDEEMSNFINCKPNPFRSERIVNFDDIDNEWILNESVEAYSMDLSTICEPEEKNIVLFPERRTLAASIKLCEDLDGFLYAPASEEENTETYQLMDQYTSECLDSNGYTIYLGAKINISTKSVQNYRNQSILAYDNYNSIEYVPEKQCIVMLSVEGVKGFWNPADCHIYEICSMCDINIRRIIKVRGLCASTTFDREYFINGIENKKSQFRGLYYSKIFWDTVTWRMVFLYNTSFYAEMVMEKSTSYPVGLTTWNVYGDECDREDIVTKQLILTSCDPGLFTCSDGGCIPLERRCDVTPDCQDGSDENDCNIARIPGSYNRQRTPISLGEPLVVSIEVNFTSMKSFSLIELKLSYDVKLKMSWKDLRLTYANLKENSEMNQISEEESSSIWHPKVLLLNGMGAETTSVLGGVQSSINKEAPPILDDVARLREDELFRGSENSIIDVQRLTVEASCQFELSMYPFDTQGCSLVVQSLFSTKSVVFNITNVNFLGARKMLEYQIEDVTGTVRETRGYSEAVITLTFTNLYKYFITGTYLPTLLLLVITYLTFFFALDDFNERIMVSLTSLMVLAALYLQSNQSIPKTAYLKLVDIWFVFCITMVFMIVLFLVIINYIRQNQNKLVHPKTSAKKIPLNVPHRLNILARIFVPISCMLFVFGYFTFIIIQM